MRVPNVGGRNWRQIKIMDSQKKPEDGFSDLMKKVINKADATGIPEGRLVENQGLKENGIDLWFVKLDETQINYDDYKDYTVGLVEFFGTNEELSKRFPHLSFPMDVELVHVDLSALTDEIKAQLNAKYQINNIKQYSKEYFALMKDLQEAGVLSDGNAYQLPPNLSDVHLGEDGSLTGFNILYPTKISRKNENFLDYTKNTLGFVADHFETISKWNPLTAEEQMAISVYEMNQNIVAAIENIFSEQLNLKK